MNKSRVLGIMATATVVVAGCATSGGATTVPTSTPSQPPDSSAPTAAPTPRYVVPAAITSAGRIVWCTDVSYPPEEFYAADGTTAQGSDIDIANEIGKRFGVTTQIDNTGFDGIIPALLAKKCDMIISGLSNTPERAAQVDFVDYLSIGEGIMVPAGNPKAIKTTDDLSGKSVAVQLGTTNKAALDTINAGFKAAGKPPMDIQTFQADTDAFQQLNIGRVDAYATDAPVLVYYVTQNPGKFELVGALIEPGPVGIAIRKEDTELKAAVTQVIDDMYTEGLMKQIVDKWGMTNAVILLK
ncbi:MAG: ABC transporter substrate-binding protein [Chloroflexi bacterium]|nr:ABC transporter substrate-binding protein [Chloroflexota bacterium]